MKLAGVEYLLAGGASVIAANHLSMTLIGMPLGGLAACFFGAAFGMLFLRQPQEDRAQRVKAWLALPVLAGVGIFGGAGLSQIVGIEKPVLVSLAGLVLSAGPVPIVRGLIAFVTATLNRRGGGNG